MLDAIRTSGQIHNFRSTCNYAQFKLVKTNRPIDSGHVMRLYDAVEKKNLLAEFPILVDSEMNVIDGQHRLKVAESLEVPIYYIVSERITVDDISSTNANTSHWTVQDYFDRWVTQGKTEYLKLERFRRKYPFLPLASSIKLCHYGDYTPMMRDFKNGEYRCNDLAFATKVAEALLDFSKFFKHYTHTGFVYALANLVANRNYDHKTMMVRLEYQSTKLVRCANMDAYIALLDEIYNYRARTKTTLRKLNSQDADYRIDRERQRDAKSMPSQDAQDSFREAA